MKYCSKCQMNIRGDKVRCPLCGRTLTGEAEDPAFPPESRKKLTRFTIISVSAFTMIALIVSLIAVSAITGIVFSWIPISILASVTAFADICITTYYRSNLIKTLAIQVYIGMILCFVVDLMTGNHGWAVTWVIPFAFPGKIIATFFIAKGLHMKLNDYVLYIVFDTAICLITEGILLGLHLIPFRIIPVLSMSVVILIFFAILIFGFREFKSASRKFFNE